MQYFYRVADRLGNIETGQDEAETSEQLLLKLRSQGKFPLEIKAETITLTAARTRFFVKRISASERLNFTRQLSNLLTSDVTLEHALGILVKLSYSPFMADVLQQLRLDLQKGFAFSAALAKFPQDFPELYINMVRAGEAGGLLAEVLNRLAQYLHDEIELKRFIVSSLFYPVIVLTASMGAIFFFVGVIIPKFQSIFNDVGSELPWITQVIMSFGNSVWRFWWIILVIIMIAIFGLMREQATVKGRLRIDLFKLKIPLLGQVLLRIATARMALALNLLTGSGIPVLEALLIASKVVGNEVIKQALVQVQTKVRQGNTLAKSMAAAKVFPTLAVEMIGVGEESGTLIKMTEHVSETYHEEVKHSLGMFLSVLEPMLIILMVAIIGILAMALLLPILRMNSAIDTVG